MKKTFHKLFFAALILALLFAAFPAAALAQSEQPPSKEISNERLEQIWARQTKLYERFGKLFNESDARLEKLQGFLDKAKEAGKDVSAVQTALDNFRAALKNAKPIYESVNGLMNSHQGFDANGKVTDAEKAQSTVREVQGKFKEIKTALGGTGKALREALKAFREANPPAQKNGGD